MQRDIISHVAVLEGVPNATYATDNTPVAIDTRGYGSGMLVFDIGVGGITFSVTNKIEFVVTHSDDNSTYTAVVDNDVYGITGITDGIVKSLEAAHAAATITRIGYLGCKRYIKVLADFSGTHGVGTPISVNFVAGRPMLEPVA